VKTLYKIAGLLILTPIIFGACVFISAFVLLLGLIRCWTDD